jgi:hypothetical protein
MQATGYQRLSRPIFYRPFVRALDIGGMVWEGLGHYPTLDEALPALDSALAEWMPAEGFE